jgi:hypothetical protein
MGTRAHYTIPSELELRLSLRYHYSIRQLLVSGTPQDYPLGRVLAVTPITCLHIAHVMLATPRDASLLTHSSCVVGWVQVQKQGKTWNGRRLWLSMAHSASQTRETRLVAQLLSVVGM